LNSNKKWRELLQHKKNKFLLREKPLNSDYAKKKDVASISALTLTVGISCYYLVLLSGKYYSPLSDFFAFKDITEALLHFNLPFGTLREPLFPLLMGLVSQIIPVKKAILYSGILLSNFTYLCSIILIHKISQRIGIKNSFLISWFFAFSSLSLFCATQPLLEATALFLILLSFYFTNEKFSLPIAGLAAFTRYDAALAALANWPKIIFKKKWRLILLTLIVLLPSAIWLVSHFFFVGKGGYFSALIKHKPFITSKPAGNFISLLRTMTLSYLPADHWASVTPETRFHDSWWVQLIWIINIFIILIGLFHLIKLNKLNNWKIPVFFLMYLFFLWFYYWTTWRFFYFIAWMFPLYTIAGIEYLLKYWPRQKKIITASILGILGIIVVYNSFNTPYIKNLYHEFFSLSFDINSLKRFLIFLPICVYALFKVRQLRSKSYLILLPLFLLITPLVSTHISTVNNMYGGLWDLKAGLNVVKNRVKNEEMILMPEKMVPCATYLSDIPEKNIVTYYTKNLFIKDIKYIASFRSWDKDPVLSQLQNKPKKITIRDQELDVTEIYHVGIFRLFRLGSIIPHGNVRIDTVHPKFGSSSVLFDGAGSHLEVADRPGWAFSSEDFTIDFWMRFANTSGTQVLVGYPYYSPDKAWQIAWEGESESIKFSYSSDGENNTDARFHWSASKDRWYHIAIVRKDSDLLAFVDGFQLGESHDIGQVSIYDSEAPLHIGSRGAEEHFNGWLDEIRISKGIARWSSNFTPNSGEYTKDSYTSLLIHFNDQDI
jgi:hypothetical protein